VSRRNNARVAVTGMLLYHDGNFMQALEGPREAVTRVFGRIERDARHGGSLVLLQADRPQRLFTEWSMAFRRYQTADLPDGYSAFLARDRTPAPTPSPDAMHRLLESFACRLR